MQPCCLFVRRQIRALNYSIRDTEANWEIRDNLELQESQKFIHDEFVRKFGSCEFGEFGQFSNSNIFVKFVTLYLENDAMDVWKYLKVFSRGESQKFQSLEI